MRSIWTRSPVRCSPPWNRPTRRKGRRGARGARPSFKDAGARLGDALAATAKAETKLAQARHRVEAAKRRTDTRGWVVQRRERTRHLIELGGLVQKAGRVELSDDDRATGSEEHTSELPYLMRISSAVFCVQKKKLNNSITKTN